VVVCADDMLAGSSPAALEVLCMLAKQPPQLLICEVGEDSAPWSSAAADVTAPWPRPAFEDATAQPAPSGALALPGDGATPDARPQLPVLQRSSLDAVLLLDGKGWVTDLDPQARTLLGMGAQRRPQGQAHLQDLIFALQAAGQDRCRSLPLVALNLDGLLSLNSQPGGRFGDAALEFIASVVQPQFARCGLLARLGANQYLAIAPHMSPSADAAVSVGGSWRAPAERKLAVTFGAAAINDADLLAGPAERSADDLREAIERRALSVHFQPQYELASGRGCGAEALSRWTLASGRIVTPDRFIPVAERDGSIAALDAWVLQTACAAALRWRGPGADRFTLAVNVPDVQVGTEYSRMLAQILRICRFPPQRLELEIGEGLIISNSGALRECLRQWKRLGVRIAVSHRSGNYSTLDYLARTPVDRLKLDKLLVHRMTHHRGTASTVQAVIALGAQLKVDVIAEGVETPAQLAMLREFNCPHAQGFLLARPMPASQARVVLAKPWGNLDRTDSAHRTKSVHPAALLTARVMASDSRI
jgi:EAL domain-containing protein (putative c-di-GMP-specific phosphodiesterase class I)